MSTTPETRLSDREFLQEILDLINGTHWMKQKLSAHCWVPLPAGKLPKDMPDAVSIDMEERLVLELSPEELEKGDFPSAYPLKEQPYFDSSTAITKKQCYLKLKNCLVGMILRVGGLGDRSEYALYHNREQELRVVELLYNELPEQFRVNMPPIHAQLGCDYRRNMVGHLESWNDATRTTKQQVIDLVTRARDQATA